MAQFFYYSYTKPTTLAVALTNTATSVQLTDGSSFPDPAIPGNGQYTALLGYGTEREEVVTVTAKSSQNVLTVIRGEDGSAALAQNAGDVVVHGVSARDFRGTLKSTGGTMTGPLILDGDATEPLEAATFQQVEARVLRSGDTMQGPLSVITPTENDHATTKDYVDQQDALKVNKAGDTMTGPLIVPTPTANGHAATKGYVDASGFVQSGLTGIDTQGANELGTQFADITFPTPFASAPRVVTGVWGNDFTGAAGASTHAAVITATGFRMVRSNPTGAIRTYGTSWVAIGVRQA